jgi:hypothetical protein
MRALASASSAARRSARSAAARAACSPASRRACWSAMAAWPTSIRSNSRRCKVKAFPRVSLSRYSRPSVSGGRRSGMHTTVWALVAAK